MCKIKSQDLQSMTYRKDMIFPDDKINFKTVQNVRVYSNTKLMEKHKRLCETESNRSNKRGKKYPTFSAVQVSRNFKITHKSMSFITCGSVYQFIFYGLKFYHFNKTSSKSHSLTLRYIYFHNDAIYIFKHLITKQSFFKGVVQVFVALLTAALKIMDQNYWRKF